MLFLTGQTRLTGSFSDRDAVDMFHGWHTLISMVIRRRRLNLGLGRGKAQVARREVHGPSHGPKRGLKRGLDLVNSDPSFARDDYDREFGMG
jgi:hypothetical protein